jgi:hypothetical protein
LIDPFKECGNIVLRNNCRLIVEIIDEFKKPVSTPSYKIYKDYINNLTNLKASTDRQQRETEAEPYSEYALTYKKLLTSV